VGSPIIWLLAVVGLVAATVLLGQRDRPFQLDSTDARGYRGLALLVEGFGADVRDADIDDLRSGGLDGVDVVYVTQASGASSADAALLWDLAAAGTKVVVGGGLPDSGTRRGLEPIAQDVFAVGGTDRCDMEELAGLTDVDLPFFEVARFDVDSVDASCLGDESSAVVARVDVGDGRVVALGSPELFTNEAMGAPPPGETVSRIPDNVVLAQRLVAPDGTTTVAVLTGGVSGPSVVSGGKGPGDFMSDGIKLALGQLLVVFAVYAWFKARRHGQPVSEPQPVSVASSDLIDAVGNLLERQGDPGRAAVRIRGRVTTELCRRLAFPPDTRPDALARILAARSGRDVAEIEEALVSGPVVDTASLVTLVHQLELIRQEALHDRPSPDPAR
jgi:hypothetical protein